MNKEETRSYVMSIDPKLQYLETLQVHSRGNFGVCLVRDSEVEENLVLKWRRSRNRHLIDREIRALEMTADLDNTPNVVRVYDNNVVGVLKTYLHGTILSCLTELDDHERRKKEAESSILDFHERGLAGVDPHRGNILIQQRGIGFFDFTEAVFRDSDVLSFKPGVSDDLTKLLYSFERR